MTSIRNAYLLTTNYESERTQTREKLLKDIGFTVNVVPHTPHTDPVISNRLSMMYIYNIIAKSSLEWAYVFEDDVEIHEKISLEEIIEYEKISSHFFYLGMCTFWPRMAKFTGHLIKGHKVYSMAGNVRGLHAIGISNNGAKELLWLSQKCPYKYMDMVLEFFSFKYPANIVRYDLQSYIPGHRGIMFQDRANFETTIG